MNNINVEMKTAEGILVSRIIDITNIHIHEGGTSRPTTSESKQRELIEEWIELRGNDQHNTKLTLISWRLF